MFSIKNSNPTNVDFVIDAAEDLLQNLLGKEVAEKANQKKEQKIFEENCLIIGSCISWSKSNNAEKSFFYKKRFLKMVEDFETYKKTRNEDLVKEISKTVEKFRKVFLWI